MRQRRFTAVVSLALLSFSYTGFSAAAPARQAGPRLLAVTGVAITGPRSGGTIVDNAVQISGSAPADVLVSINIVDTDTARSSIRHQPGGHIEGSATSGANGTWVFVPQLSVALGQYSVTASYLTAQRQPVTSSTVPFVVVNSSGQSAVGAPSWTSRILLALLAAGLLIGGFAWYRRGDQHPRRFAALATLHRRAPSVRAQMEPRRRTSRPAAPMRPRPQVSPPRSPEASGSRPLFMTTAAGKNYQLEQAQKLREINDEIQEIERCVSGTAEELERSYGAVSALLQRVGGELAAHDARAGHSPASLTDPGTPSTTSLPPTRSIPQRNPR